MTPQRFRRITGAFGFYLKGMCMGTADIIPGVSGGTMAYILGIYDRLLGSIRGFNANCIWQVFTGRFGRAFNMLDGWFMLPLILGIFSAFMFFVHVVPMADYLETHPEQVYGFFFGLIVGSIWVLMKGEGRHKRKDWALIAVGTLLGYLFVTLVPVSTPTGSLMMILYGFVAVCAMLLPGVSGSFTLLVLGQYGPMLRALENWDFSLILPFMLGGLLGALTFAHTLGYLFKHFPRPTIMIINGVLIGTLYRIWPFQDRIFGEVDGKEMLIASHPVLPMAWNSGVTYSLLWVVAGLVVVWAMQIYADAMRRKRVRGF